MAEILAGGPEGVPASEEFTKFVDERSGGNRLFIELILEFPQQLDMADRVGKRWRSEPMRGRGKLSRGNYARAALSCGQSSEGGGNVANALTACEGVTVPLAEWRAHATSAMIYRAVEDTAGARPHTRLGETVRKRLAESLPEGHPLRRQFEHRRASLFAI
jgi:hypothetical protein